MQGNISHETKLTNANACLIVGVKVVFLNVFVKFMLLKICLLLLGDHHHDQYNKKNEHFIYLIFFLFFNLLIRSLLSRLF